MLMMEKSETTLTVQRLIDRLRLSMKFPYNQFILIRTSLREYLAQEGKMLPHQQIKKHTYDIR